MRHFIRKRGGQRTLDEMFGIEKRVKWWKKWSKKANPPPEVSAARAHEVWRGHMWGMTTGQISEFANISQPAVVYILKKVIGCDITMVREKIIGKKQAVMTEEERIEEFINLEDKLHPEPIIKGIKISHYHLGPFIFFHADGYKDGDTLRFTRSEIFDAEYVFYERWFKVFSRNFVKVVLTADHEAKLEKLYLDERKARKNARQNKYNEGIRKIRKIREKEEKRKKKLLELTFPGTECLKK